MGDTEKAQYFHNRCMKGIQEKKDSRDRALAIATYNKKI